ncbi:MAG: hypothetical protein V8S08_03410 [Lachnoclostridium sp.]
MLNFLPQAVILLLLIVLLGFFNEKVTKFPYEISLMLYSVVVGIGGLILASVIRDASVSEIFENLQVFNLEGFLMEGVLCFMLFAGSCHMRLLDFKKHARPITLLSIGATLLGAIFYGVLFYAGASYGVTVYFSGLPDVREYYSTDRPDCGDKYSEEIQPSERD